MVRAKHFQNPATRQLNVRALWASLTINPVACCLGVVGLFIGVTACGNLVEIYRTRAGIWHDAALWQVEKDLFAVLLASPLNVPTFWDTVYFFVWSGLFLGSSLLFVTGHKSRFFLLVTALVWAYVLTRVTAIYYPTQGPVFFVPEMFNLAGTISAETQRALALYMAGQIPQNGLLPGTMGMPSLHVGMPFLVTCLLARELPRTLWLTVPWFVLNWASTVFLGWHYAVDGLGGIAIALIALGLAWIQQRAWDSVAAGSER
jgi:membrane-associated phospholipid phosphatase